MIKYVLQSPLHCSEVPKPGAGQAVAIAMSRRAHGWQLRILRLILMGCMIIGYSCFKYIVIYTSNRGGTLNIYIYAYIFINTYINIAICSVVYLSPNQVTIKRFLVVDREKARLPYREHANKCGKLSHESDNFPNTIAFPLLCLVYPRVAY